jgi:integrase
MDTVRLPKYRRHKSSGLAVVTLGGRQIYLGRYGTAASRQAYYVRDGKPSGELVNVRTAMRHLKALYGDTPAADFGPLAFNAVRATIVATNLSRSTCNRYADIIRRAFKWAVATELVPPSVYQGLRAVDGLRREPVRPVAEAYVRKVLPFLPPAVAAMVDLQVLTGMRSGEVVLMRGRDLNTAGPTVWQYRPAHHKTAHHGYDRVIDLGPRAEAILRPWLRADLEGYLFSPQESEAARNAARRAAVLTGVLCRLLHLRCLHRASSQHFR